MNTSASSAEGLVSDIEVMLEVSTKSVATVTTRVVAPIPNVSWIGFVVCRIVALLEASTSTAFTALPTKTRLRSMMLELASADLVDSMLVRLDVSTAKTVKSKSNVFIVTGPLLKIKAFYPRHGLLQEYCAYLHAQYPLDVL